MVGIFSDRNKPSIVPELPEVEVVCCGIRPFLENGIIRGAVIRTPRLRQPILPILPQTLAGRTVTEIRRRGKYLLLRCAAAGEREPGWLLIHLGMSGSLRWLPGRSATDSLPGRHDHVDLEFSSGVLRFADPRRFGVVAWHAGEDVDADPLLASLGIEPFADEFDGHWLHAAFATRQAAVKPVLMDAHTLVGVGNIYASESLFRAGISPLRPARNIAARRCDRLATSIRETLAEAIEAGGSSIRDYVHADGGAGCFQVNCFVYERAGQDCRICGHAIRQVRQAGRSTYYCPVCQR